MNDKDLAFFQNIAEQLLLYCAQSTIDNRETMRKADETRKRFLLYREEREQDTMHRTRSPQNVPCRARPADRKLNTEKNQNLKGWTKKEIEDMPYLKDLSYRITVDGVHQFRFRRHGYNVSFNSVNYEVAKNKAREFIKKLNRLMGKEIKPAHVNSLDYVADLYFKQKGKHVGEETIRAYLSTYINHVKPAFGNRAISRILPMDLQPFFDDLFSRHGKTCENCKIILNGVFKFALSNRLCSHNPMDGVIIERHYRTPGKTLDDEQIKRFKSAMLAAGERGTTYLVILYSGIRGSEVERMTFDWERGTFTVYNAKLKKSQRANPNNLTRTVPIFPGLYKIRERIERDAWRYPARVVSNYFSELWTESSVKDLRHTFVSKARESKIENELVNLWTGHLPGKNVTANVYTHFSEKYQIEESKKLVDY